MKKVLIIDDQPQISRILSDVLIKSGFQIEIASNGLIGVNKAKEYKPDLIFMDVMMPVQNGYEATKEIRLIPEFRSTPIIFLTAKGQSSDQEEAMKAGATEFLEKPFSPKKILEIVKTYLTTQ